jgi:8-oxo-dGTP pyrophosphatase MutT (NUDIX family)
MHDSQGIITYSAAGGVVVDETGDHVLLLIRPSRDEVRLPKGHIEPGEAPLAAALREVQEEAGYGDLEMMTDLGEQLVTFLLDGKMIRRTERYFLLRARSEARTERPTTDADQFYTVWVPWDEVKGHLTFEAEREWAQRAREAWEVIW